MERPSLQSQRIRDIRSIGIKMRVRTLLLLSFPLITNLLGMDLQQNIPDCAKCKKVEGIGNLAGIYNFHAQNSECDNGCSYTRDDGECCFCFAPGNYSVTSCDNGSGINIGCSNCPLCGGKEDPASPSSNPLWPKCPGDWKCCSGPYLPWEGCCRPPQTICRPDTCLDFTSDTTPIVDAGCGQTCFVSETCPKSCPHCFHKGEAGTCVTAPPPPSEDCELCPDKCCEAGGFCCTSKDGQKSCFYGPDESSGCPQIPGNQCTEEKKLECHYPIANAIRVCDEELCLGCNWCTHCIQNVLRNDYNITCPLQCILDQCTCDQCDCCIQLEIETFV